MIALLFNYVSRERQTVLKWGELSLAVNKQAQLETTDKNMLPAEGIAVQSAKVRLGKIQFSFNPSSYINAYNTQLLLNKIVPLASQSGFSLLFGAPASSSLQNTEAEARALNSHAITMTFQVNEIFKDEIIVSIHSKDQQAHISFTAPFDTHSTKSVSTAPESSIQTLSISAPRGRTYALRILGEGQFKKSKGRWVITTQSKYTVMRYGNTQTNGFKTIERMPIISNAIRNDSKRAVATYIEKAYRGWTKTRYDDKTATYLHPEGVYGFSEQALIASFAEAKKRGDFIGKRLTFDRIAHLYRNARTWRSAALRFENPVEISHYMRNIQNTQSSVRQSMQEKNYVLLLDITLMETTHAFFETRAQRELLSFIHGMPSSALSPQIAASLLIQYSMSSWTEFRERIAEKKSVLEQIILENITVANAGYLLRQNANELTVFYSVIAGQYLANFGATNSIKNIGHRMIVTALSLSDEFGFLPRIYVLKNKTTFSLGFITPEMFYHVLVNNPYYPHTDHSAYDTQAVSTSIVPQSDEANLVIFATAPHKTSFATKRIHIDIDIPNADTTQYVFILQVPKPKNIYAFDTLWSGEYFISKTSRAVYYDAKNKIAVIKINSKKKTERISFLY